MSLLPPQQEIASKTPCFSGILVVEMVDRYGTFSYSYRYCKLMWGLVTFDNFNSITFEMNVKKCITL